MSTTIVRLWFHCTTAPPREENMVWVPKSIIEHTSEQPNGLHEVKLPDWFVEKEGL